MESYTLSAWPSAPAYTQMYTHGAYAFSLTCPPLPFSPPAAQISTSVMWSPTSASLANAPTPPAASSAPVSQASYSLTTNGAAMVRETAD